jgi:hypothetical protein
MPIENYTLFPGNILNLPDSATVSVERGTWTGYVLGGRYRMAMTFRFPSRIKSECSKALLLWLLLAVCWLSLSAVPRTNAATILTRLPYLQLSTPNSIVVRWRTDSDVESCVQYSQQPADLITWTPFCDNLPTTEHRVQLDGLMPDTKYFYAIGNPTDRLAGGDAVHFFVTAPSTSKLTRIWVLGDSGTADANALAVRDSYFAFTAGQNRHTDLWLMLGDNAYGGSPSPSPCDNGYPADDGSDARYQSSVFNLYADLLNKAVLWPTIGNHDTAGCREWEEGGIAYHRIFSLPRPDIGRQTEDYYSFNYGNLHFISLLDERLRSTAR